MAQLTIYLDESTLEKVEKAAGQEGISLSRWAREKLAAASESNTWPVNYGSLLGSLRDESFVLPRELPAKEDRPVEF